MRIDMSKSQWIIFFLIFSWRHWLFWFKWFLNFFLFKLLLWFLLCFLFGFLLHFLLNFRFLSGSFFNWRVILFFLNTIFIKSILIEMNVQIFPNLDKSHLILTFVKKGKICSNKIVYFFELFNSRQLNDNCFEFSIVNYFKLSC